MTRTSGGRRTITARGDDGSPPAAVRRSEDVNRLLQARKQMEKMMKAMGKGKLRRSPRVDGRRRPSGASAPLARRISGTLAAASTEEGERRSGSSHEIDARRIEEETDLSRRRGPIRARRVTVASSRSSAVQPQTDPSTIDLDAEKVKDWLGKGDQPSGPGRGLIKAAGSSRPGGWTTCSPGSHAGSSTTRKRFAWSASTRGTSSSPVHVAPDDVGKVIGRQGRVARALRTVVRAAAHGADRASGSRSRTEPFERRARAEREGRSSARARRSVRRRRGERRRASRSVGAVVLVDGEPGRSRSPGAWACRRLAIRLDRVVARGSHPVDPALRAPRAGRGQLLRVNTVGLAR